MSGRAREEYTCIWRSGRANRSENRLLYPDYSLWRASKDRNSFPVAKVDTRREEAGRGPPGVFGISRFRRTRSTQWRASYRSPAHVHMHLPMYRSEPSQLRALFPDHTRYRVNHPTSARDLAKLSRD